MYWAKVRGPGQPAASGLIADKAEPHERPRVFNIIAFSNAIAATLISLLAGLPAYFHISFELEEIDAYRVSF